MEGSVPNEEKASRSGLVKLTLALLLAIYDILSASLTEY